MTADSHLRHFARPLRMGSWTFQVMHGDPHGEVVAAVALTGLMDQGAIHVGDVPFDVEREGLSRTYELRFEGLTLARAEITTPIVGTTYEIRVDAALLSEGVASGSHETYTLEPLRWGGTSAQLRHRGRIVGILQRESIFVRHYTLRFDDDVPLVLRAFCFALVLARLRRQSRNG